MITHIARAALLGATALALSSSAALAQSVTRYSYDPLGQLSAVGSATGETSANSYDLAGNRTQVETRPRGWQALARA